MNDQEISLVDYWRILKKRKRIFFYTFIIIFLATYIFTERQKPVYQATVDIKIEKSEEDPTMWDQWGGDNNLTTEIQIIKSLPIMQNVVEKVEALPIDEEAKKSRVYGIARNYQNRVKVKQIPQTDIVSITTSSTDPKKAALMANAIADIYMKESVEGRRRQARAIIQYADKQLSLYRKMIEEQEIKLHRFQHHEKVFEVTPEIKNTLDRMTADNLFEFEKDMMRIQPQIRKLKAILKARKKSKVLSFLSEENLANNFMFMGMRRRILELEFEKFLLLIDYTKKHPLVVQKDNRIRDVKGKIVSGIKDSVDIHFDIEAEEDFAFLMKKMFLEDRGEVLYRIINKSYGVSGSLSSNQRKYLEIKRNVERTLSAYDVLSVKKEEALLTIAKEVASVTVVSPAVTPRSPVSPVKRVNYLVGSVAGLLLGLMLAFVSESMDVSIASIEDVEKHIGLPILGIIPHIKLSESFRDKTTTDSSQERTLVQRERIISISSPNTREAESFKTVRTNLMQVMNLSNRKSILFTSSDKGEGKTTTIINTAVSFAQIGKKTLLLGANLRRPTIFKIFGINRAPGLTDVVIGKDSWEDVVKSSSDILMGEIGVDNFLQVPGIENLSIMTCGQSVNNPSELLNSHVMNKLLRDLKNNFDVVMIDCSPTLPVTDSIILAGKVDGVVLVYRSGITGRDALSRTKIHLEHVNASILGIVLSDITPESQMGLTSYFNTYYGSEEKKYGENFFGHMVRKLLKAKRRKNV